MKIPTAFTHLECSDLRITDQEMLEGIKEIASTEGVFVAPEGAAV